MRDDDNRNSHFKLEYRIVICHGGIHTGSYDTWTKERCNGLEQRAFDLISDIVTVANNLGFACSDGPKSHRWEPNKQNKIMLENGQALVAVRAFKNGNMHFHFNQRVMLAINVEAGRLLGWLNSPKEAVDELQATGDDAEFIKQKFGGSFRIAPNNVLRIGSNVPAPPARLCE